MKEKIIAAAVIAAAAGAASAADVTIYGNVDLGVSVTHVDGKTSTEMKSGMRNSSRFGLKGTEALADGYTVGFVLESQFKADDGTLQNAGTLWERESSLWLATPFGKFTVGRVGYLKGSVGSTALLNSYRVNPFGGLMSNYITGFKAYTTGTAWYVTNGFVYASPKIADTEVFFQYSNGHNNYNTDDSGKENDNDRYYAAAVRYMNGPLLVQMIADTTNLGNAANKSSVNDHNSRDPMSLGLQAAYDFGFVKPFVMAEVFKDSQLNKVGGATGRTVSVKGGYDGAGGTVVLQWPMWGGQAKAGVGYLKAHRAQEDSSADKRDIMRRGASIGYDYALTKKTHVYADAGWFGQKESMAGDATVRSHGSECVAGMVHYF